MTETGTHVAPAGGTREPAEIAAWLRLVAAPGLGPVGVRRLLSAYGLPERILAQDAAALAQLVPAGSVRALLAAPGPALAALVARTAEWAAMPGNHLLTLADAAYPAALLDLADPPPLLYLHGDLAALRRPAIALVGARSASAQGARDAQAFARALAGAGLCVVSGLAAGIDAAAHLGALEGAGGTLAVVGTGIDQVYPARHRALAGRIAGHGAMLSEFALGTPPRSHHFPQRNRLIAALARGVLVVEAAARSGSLITARLAAELGREVFAIPGSIHAPLSRGCHLLIRDGAKLVESAQDVLEELGTPGQPAAEARGAVPRGRHAAEAGCALGAALGFEPASLDELCRRSGLGASQALAGLLSLELAGLAERLPGNLFRRLA
ncbi:DNA protecting protein DprA [Cupriavidus sp. USMAA2-4]|uniref:DNA protecting protein DprA n=1 Tax=Cupriavidus malaysiensis TaxID=367825 RepID=A0ABM6F018_9BURK|nr:MULTISPECIES: DNA-processing protein DprA [Cupriavidus]AOY92284.1 DNA protecting protein DprA [Cupriavidus sp. USMAA2-4]AOY98135.1 DNA protecting protein DprA [Cupriavidus sp. USMAHM13]AOZ04572.1 DNA protecting protein DprA [Cupriavidus malaysiensis]